MQREGLGDIFAEASEQSSPAFFVEAADEGQIVLSVCGVDGKRTRLSTRTPAEELLRAVEIDYTQLRDEVMRLWETYPLDGTDRARKKKELARLSEEVLETSELLREIDPPGYFYVTQRLEQPTLDAALASEDIDLTDVGARLLTILEAPALAQVRLRNLFEVAFDGMERATQRERYELLASTYPSAVGKYYPARQIADAGDVPFDAAHVEYRVEEPDELYRLLLMLYFSQSRQRIARCECCFGYFIPKTKRATIYCDRVFDGKSCKAAGSGWKYTAAMDRDAVLRIYDTLRHERAASYSEYMGLFKGRSDPEYVNSYEAWCASASAAREAYLAREIDAAEFLRRIEYDGEAEPTAPEKQGKSEWRRNLERDIDFDPWMEYRGMMALDLSAEDASWEITTAAKQVREAQGEHRGLREKYGKK